VTALAIIIGRAGSKGLPNKNARLIAGRPCVQWSILDARECPAIMHVVVSTDGPEIAAAAKALGCEALPRDATTASDGATVDAAARDALTRWERAHAPLADDAPIALLYANVPVRPPGLIAAALGRYHQEVCDSVQSFTPVGKHHPWWTVRVEPSTGALAPWEGQKLFHDTFRRQDLPPAFMPDGGVIVVSRRALRLDVFGALPGPHQFFGLRRLGVVSPAGSVIDIDNEIDALVAEAVLTRRSAPADARTHGGSTHAGHSHGEHA